MRTIDRNKQLGKKLLKEAKHDISYRQKDTKHQMNQAILEGVSSEVRQPVTAMGDPVKAFEHRKRNKIACCICGITAGTFYIKDGEKFCSDDKQFMDMSKEERELLIC